MKKLPLYNRHGAVISFTRLDDTDADSLSCMRWHLSTYGYAKNSKKELLHRILLGVGAGLEIDHIDGDGLNNQRANLRICTRQQNMMNQRKQKRLTSSQYKGVRFDKERGQWRAEIGLPGTKRKFLGRFPREDEAAVAYNVAALEKYGDFACLNVIERPELP